MKQIIVLASFIALGIFIAGIVMGFKDDVDDMGKNTTTALKSITSTMEIETKTSSNTTHGEG